VDVCAYLRFVVQADHAPMSSRSRPDPTRGSAGLLAVACVAVLFAGCANSANERSAQQSSASTTMSATTGPSKPSTSVSLTPPTTTAVEVESMMVDVGNGKEFFLECRGVGSPTILLDAGDESGHEDWSKVDRVLGEATRTCSYDRQGTGQSSDAEGCRRIDDLIGDTEALIEAAGLQGPFIFVGASGGGYLAAEMAVRHPTETAGLVLVETPKAIEDIPPDVAPLLPCDAPTNVERRDYVAVEHAVWDDKHEIGQFPVVIFSNDAQPEAEGDEATNVWVASAMAASTTAGDAIAKSGRWCSPTPNTSRPAVSASLASSMNSRSRTAGLMGRPVTGSAVISPKVNNPISNGRGTLMVPPRAQQ
jgi:pimeloyl-ACP methyl ester carboxylesterase